MKFKKQLIKEIDQVCDKDKILVCFPFAGGGASAYNNWKKSLNTVINICPIQLPGREERITEEPYEDMETVVDDIVLELKPYKNHKIYFFGHSMGAKMAYEVAKKMEADGNKIKMLIVSGSRAPHVLEPNPICSLLDSEFVTELRRFEGIPEEILNNSDLLNFFLPIFKSDFKMDENYCAKEITRLECSIVAFGGKEDQEANENEIKEWEQYTNNKFDYKMFVGGHFFIKQQESEVLNAIKKGIEKKIEKKIQNVMVV